MDSQAQSHASERIDTGSSSETATKGLRAIRERQDYKVLVDATIRSFVLDLGDDDSEDGQNQTTACESLGMWPQLRQGMTKMQKQAASRLIAFDELSHLLTTALQQNSLQIRSQNWKDCRIGARSRKLLYDNMRDFFKMAPEEHQQAMLLSTVLSNSATSKSPSSESTANRSVSAVCATEYPISMKPSTGSDFLETRQTKLPELDSKWTRIVDDTANEGLLTELGSKMLCDIYPIIKKDAKAALSQVSRSGSPPHGQNVVQRTIRGSRL